MIPIKHTIPFGLLSCLALLGSVKADGSTSNTSWPEWVTNDYDCGMLYHMGYVLQTMG